MLKTPTFFLLLLLVFFSFQLSAESLLFERLKKVLPGSEIHALEPNDQFKEIFEIRFPQFIDHQNPSLGTFYQKIYLGHAGYKQPIVVDTEGYAAFFYTKELSKILHGNQIIIEHRYFGKSIPKPKGNWEYLTAKQAAADTHRIIKSLKSIYKKNWVSTGISKGGMNALIHNYLYPRDVKAVVAYVTPIIQSREDQRIEQHLNSVGSEECRSQLSMIQETLLRKRNEILPILEKKTIEKGKTLSIGLEVAFEYAVLEMPFSFWQWNANCSSIPQKDASPQKLFDFLDKTVNIFGLYSDKAIKYYHPSFVQHQKELGYYGFPFDHLEPLLEKVKSPDNSFFAPAEVSLQYENTLIKNLIHSLQKKKEKIIYIYGAMDTWYACAVSPRPGSNSIKMVKPNGTHSTRIKDFSKTEQAFIYNKLEKWVNADTSPVY